MEIAVLTSDRLGMQSLLYVKWNTWLALFFFNTHLYYFFLNFMDAIEIFYLYNHTPSVKLCRMIV